MINGECSIKSLINHFKKIPWYGRVIGIGFYFLSATINIGDKILKKKEEIKDLEE